jgi:hypothetical protein
LHTSDAQCLTHLQTFEWLAFALRGADFLDNPATEVQQDEVFALILSALVQSFLMVVSWTYVMDNSERVARQLDAAAPRARAAADEGALSRCSALLLGNGCACNGTHNESNAAAARRGCAARGRCRRLGGASELGLLQSAVVSRSSCTAVQVRTAAASRRMYILAASW